MKRRLFAILSALSLLLFVAVCVLWARSYFVGGEAYWARSGDLYSAGIGNGHLLLLVTRLAPERGPWKPQGMGYRRETPGSAGEMPLTTDPRSTWSIAGFGWRHRSSSFLRQFGLRQPLWFVSLIAAIVTGIFWKKSRPLSPGLCPTCGYDLRATPDRCPECGTEVPSAPSA